MAISKLFFSIALEIKVMRIPKIIKSVNFTYNSEDSVFCNGSIFAISAEIASSARFKPGCLVSPGVSVRSSTVFGKDIFVEEYVRVGRSCVLKDGVTIGKNATLMDGVFIGQHVYVPEESILMDNSVVEESVSFKGKVEIGEGSYLSLGVVVEEKVIISDAVHLGSHCVIGANSAISPNTKVPSGFKVPSNSLVKSFEVGMSGERPQDILSISNKDESIESVKWTIDKVFENLTKEEIEKSYPEIITVITILEKSLSDLID